MSQKCGMRKGGSTGGSGGDPGGIQVQKGGSTARDALQNQWKQGDPLQPARRFIILKAEHRGGGGWKSIPRFRILQALWFPVLTFVPLGCLFWLVLAAQRIKIKV